MHPPFLIDADAFLCVRKFGLLSILESKCSGVVLLMTGHIARNELSSVAATVEQLEDLGALVVHAVLVGTPAALERRRLIRDGVDKGEAEAFGWARQQSAPPPFITCDRSARRHAARLHLVTGDPFDLAIGWLDAGLLTSKQVLDRFAPWEDAPHSLWRPRDFTTVEETLRSRRR